jgi:hypothetical protein
MMNLVEAQEKAKAALEPLGLYKGDLGDDAVKNLVNGTEACFYIERYCIRVRRNGLIEIDPINPKQPC